MSSNAPTRHYNVTNQSAPIPTSETVSTTASAAIVSEEDTEGNEHTDDTEVVTNPSTSQAGLSSTYTSTAPVDQTDLTGEPTVSSVSTTVTSHPQFLATVSAISTQSYTTAQQNFSNLFSDSWMNDPNIDINGLIQAVMRNAYEDNQQDLKYYALKVQFYNNLKKAMRNELDRARSFQATHEQSGSNSGNTQLTQPYLPAPQLDYNFDGTNTQPVTQTQALANGAAATAGGSTSTSTPTTSASTTGGGIVSTVSTATYTNSSGNCTLSPPLWGANSGPNGTSNGTSAADWQVYQTKAGYLVAICNDPSKDIGGAVETRIYGPGNNPKLLDQVWGDPHLVTTPSSSSLYTTPGGTPLNTDGNSALVLPDGTTVAFNTQPSGDAGTAVTTSVDVVSGNDRWNVPASGTPAYTADGSTYDAQNPLTGFNGSLFALGADGSASVYSSSSQTYDGISSPNGGNATVGGAANVTAGQTAVGQSQGNVITTNNQMDAYVQNMEDQLQSVGDDAQLAQVDLQNMAQNQQQTLETLSNLSKSFSDLSLAIIRNISG